MKKKRPLLYIPWYTKDEDFYEEEGEDSWISYIRRNLPHAAGGDSPFPGSSWSYTTHDSPFENDEDPLMKSDETLYEEISEALYLCPDVDASNIKIIVLNGVVSLFGFVDNLHAKKEAGRVALQLEGVWAVHNELEVQDTLLAHS